MTATLMPWYYLAQTLSIISTRKETHVKCSNAVRIFLLLLAVPSLQAADLKTEEAAIRAAIASGQAKATDDEIVWTGHTNGPLFARIKEWRFQARTSASEAMKSTPRMCRGSKWRHQETWRTSFLIRLWNMIFPGLRHTMWPLKPDYCVFGRR